MINCVSQGEGRRQAKEDDSGSVRDRDQVQFKCGVPQQGAAEEEVSLVEIATERGGGRRGSRGDCKLPVKKKRPVQFKSFSRVLQGYS